MSITEKLKEAMQSAEHTEENIKVLKMQLSEMREGRDNAVKEAIRLKDERDSANRGLEHWKDQACRVIQERDDIKAARDALRDQVIKLRMAPDIGIVGQLEQITAERDKVIHELGQAKVSITEWRNLYDRADKRRDELKHYVDRLIEGNKTLNRFRDELREDNARLRATANQPSLVAKPFLVADLASATELELLTELGRRINKELFPVVGSNAGDAQSIISSDPPNRGSGGSGSLGEIQEMSTNWIKR